MSLRWSLPVLAVLLLPGAPCLEAGNSEALLPARESQPGFTRLPPESTGIRFTNQLATARSAANRNLLGGSGVAAGDIDGDGWCDLYFCGLDNPNALYRNLGGWRFEEITGASDVACEGWDATGAVFADADGDGDLDLFVTALGQGAHLFANDGRGKFTNRTVEAGLSSRAGATSLALADADGDGDLDLYVANFRADTIRDRPATRFTIEYAGGKPVVAKVDGRSAAEPELANRFMVSASGEVIEYGEADVLYENTGAGQFQPVPWTGGRFLDENGLPLQSPPLDWGLAVQFRDFTGDGAPDLYICNDYWTPDRVWINDGRGGFRALGPSAWRQMPRSSMGVDFADVDRDGNFDFFAVDMLSRSHRHRQTQVGDGIPWISVPGEMASVPQFAQNMLQLNRGDGTFAQIASYSGLEASEWSWCPVFIDVDLDGWEDILVSNGHRKDFQDADAGQRIQQAITAKQLSFGAPERVMEFYPGAETAPAAFRNNGDLTFSDAGGAWGLADPGVAHGLCLTDLDHDGDQDAVMNRLGAAAGIYRNDGSAPRVAVRLRGAGGNPFGIGAKITVRGGFPFAQSQEMIAGGRYLSGDAPERTFAARGTMEIEVRWRSGKVARVPGAEAGRRYMISENTE